jgi:hypothetical protein
VTVHHPPLLAIASAAFLAGAACGPTSEERVMDTLAARCARLRGAAYAQAQETLAGGYPVGPRCSAALAPLPDGDSCGAATAGDEVCQVIYAWFSADPGACPGGACTCELRLRRNALEAQQGLAEVCAARFLRGDPLDPAATEER